MKKYRINSDQEYFEKYAEMADRVRGLGSLFQNLNVVATEQELIEWQDIADEAESDLCDLIHEAQFRIEEIQEAKNEQISK